MHSLTEGARLLIECDGIEFANVGWTRKNLKAGRPFIEHQLEIMYFYVGLECATRARADVQLIHPDQIVANFPGQRIPARNPFTLRVSLSHRSVIHDIGLVPDPQRSIPRPSESVGPRSLHHCVSKLRARTFAPSQARRFHAVSSSAAPRASHQVSLPVDTSLPHFDSIGAQFPSSLFSHVPAFSTCGHLPSSTLGALSPFFPSYSPSTHALPNQRLS
jgi:hypothetical protein